MSELSELESIFFTALGMVPAERATYLAQACAGDESLRRQVERMLAAQVDGESFLEVPASAIVAQGNPTIDRNVIEKIGSQIGPYKLLQQIGEGGFGVVFMAEQLEPVRRKVALKVIKPGMDTRQVIARFEAERQALAVMDHPNIAKVLDAGEVRSAECGVRSEETADLAAALIPHSALRIPQSSGRPYFVMELVRGIPITQYCDENSLTVRERLELFATVCQAIQHAHTKGIIHRDIKPTNVMVTRQDGQPVVKVIDFGIAKAMGQQLTDKTLFTEFAQMIGTPLYMSPEQAELSSTDIDTRSDIYSLGVLLYELLTGSTPVSKDQLKQAAFDEIRRIIREEDPPKPSTRISTAEAAPSIAAQRHTEPAKLTKLVRGELDWIVMKALEKDRNRRYETANGLAMDVKRYLADEHVLACPPSAAYRLRKFARRNRMVLTTAAVVMMALIAGAAVASWQAIRATKAQKLAQERLEKEKEAREEATANLQKARDAGHQFFSHISESTILEEPGLQPLRQQLLKAAVAYYEGLIPQSGNDPKVQVDVILARLRLAQVYYQVGVFDQYNATLDQALDLVEKLIQENPEASELHLRLAGFWHGGRGLGEPKVWESPQALPTLRRAVACWERLARRYPEAIGFQCDLSKFYDVLGTMEDRVGSKEETLRLRQMVCELRENIVRATPGVYENIAELGHAYIYLARALEETNAEEAEGFFRQAVAIQKDAPNVSSYQRFLDVAHYQLGRFLRDQGRGVEALPCLLEAIAINEKLAEQFPHVSVFRARSQQLKRQVDELRRSLGQISDARPANPPRQQALALLKNLQPDDAGAVFYAAARLQSQAGDDQVAAKESQKAEQSYRTAISLFAALPPEISTLAECRDALCVVHVRLGDLFRATNRPGDAENSYRAALRVAEELATDFPDVLAHRSRLATLRRALAWIYANLGRAQEAEREHRQALTELEKLVAASPQEPNHRRLLALTHIDLAGLLAARQQRQEAEQASRQAIDLLSALTAEFPQKETYWQDLGRAHACLAEWDQAVADFTKVIELEPDFAPAWHGRGWAHANLGEWDQALADYAKASELKPDFGDAWFGRGLAHANLGQWDEAIAHYTKALEFIPQRWWTWCRRAQAHSALKQWDQAIRDCAQAIELGATDAEVWLTKAAAHASLEQWDQALDDYAKAIERNAAYLPVAVERFKAAGRSQEAAQLARQAVAAAEKLTAEFPQAETHWYHLGLVHTYLGQWDQAVAGYTKSIELKPDRADAWHMRAFAHVNLGQWDDAIAACRRALELDPKHAKARRNLVWALGQKGWGLISSPDPKLRDPKRAIETNNEAVEVAPQSSMAWQYLGWVQYRVGDWRASIETLEKSCKLQEGGTGDAGQWIVQALAHARLAAQDGLPEKEREHHQAEARRQYEEADKQIDRWWRVRPGHVIGQAIWDFREEARELMKKESGVRDQESEKPTSPH